MKKNHSRIELRAFGFSALELTDRARSASGGDVRGMSSQVYDDKVCEANT